MAPLKSCPFALQADKLSFYPSVSCVNNITIHVRAEFSLCTSSPIDRYITQELFLIVFLHSIVFIRIVQNKIPLFTYIFRPQNDSGHIQNGSSSMIVTVHPSNKVRDINNLFTTSMKGALNFDGSDIKSILSSFRVSNFLIKWRNF